MDPREGSSQIEAAFVFPLVILIVAAFIAAGSQIYSRVSASAAAHYEDASETLSGGGISAEEIMRARRFIE